jgi:CSLREA domain-containing protein
VNNKHLMNRPQLAHSLLKLSLLVTATLLFIALGAVSSVSAAPGFRVNNTGDNDDASPGNGICETASGNGVCTLRAAIQEAIVNANMAIGITFSIPTSDPGYNAQTGAWTINLGSALPLLNKSSRLDPTTLNITGPGANLLIVQRNVAAQFRIFNVTTTGTVNISDLTITGGALSEDGGGILNAGSGTMNITNCTLRNNTTGSAGGAVANSTGTVAITNCTLERNAAAAGGAIRNSGTLNITRSIVRLNFAAGYGGGGVSNGGTLAVTDTTIADNRAISSDYRDRGLGGGILSVGPLTLANSTISGNSARGLDAVRGSLTSEAFGGGIYGSGNINIVNCTISGNRAEGGNCFDRGSKGKGGAIGYGGNGIFNLSNSTISGNSAQGGYGAGGPASSDGGGIFNAAMTNATFNIKSTIVANNSADVGPDVEGSFASQGFNLIGKNDGSTGFISATDKKGTVAKPLNPKLGVLQNNGGPTETIALISSSPAVDKGSSVGLTGNLTTDQRGAGFPRTVDRAPANANGGDGTDIGAFELPAQ